VGPSFLRNPPLTAELVHREIVKLLVLVACAVVAFFATRAFADASRTAGLRDAERWFIIGQAHLDQGEVQRSIEAFRRATLKDRTNRTYGLALARAEARAGQGEAAERTLLTLRDGAPEDPRINLELARAASRRNDVPAAVRYYHHAVYGVWDTGGGPEQVRLELIQFLLRHDERRLALAELLAATREPAAGADDDVRFGQLFLDAGEPRRARDHFERALRVESRLPDALAGAGIAAFRLGDYRGAAQYLRTVPDDNRTAREAREIATLVLASDPLEGRLAPAERRRRLMDGLAYARRRLEACQGGTADTLAPEVGEFEHRLSRRDAGDRDTLEDGVDLVYRATRAFEACGAPSALDRAWLLIGERHGAAS